MTVINRRSDRTSAARASLLAAACLFAGIGLAGCEQPMSATAEAQKVARDAAARAMSAGGYRATDALQTAALNAGTEEGAIQQLENTVKAQLETYIKRNSAEQDLKEAAEEIRKATSADIEAGAKSAIMSTAGSINLRLSEVRLASVQQDIPEISELSRTIEALAASSLELSSQADSLEAYAKNNQPNRADATKAAADAAAARKAADDKAAEVKATQEQIAARQNQARQIYGAADAAFLAADQRKGKDAIDAANKAIADRGQADTLLKEAGELNLKLAQLQGEQALLEIRAKDADTVRKLAEASFETATKNDQQVQARIAALRDAAGKVLTGPGGVVERMKSLQALVAANDKTPDLATRIEQAAKAAADAAQAFSQAAASYSAYVSDLGQKSSEIQDAKDPIRTLVADNRMKALYSWSKSAALHQEAQAHLAGAQLGATVDRALKLAGKAGEKFNIKPEQLTAINPADQLAKAAEKFKEAADAADQGLSVGGRDVDLLKWLGHSMKALAKHGSYLAGDQAALAEAKAAREEAARISPMAGEQLSWIGQ